MRIYVVIMYVPVILPWFVGSCEIINSMVIMESTFFSLYFMFVV